MYYWSRRKHEISGHVQAVPYLSSNKVPVRIPSEFASSMKLQSLELHLYTNCCLSYYSFGEKFEGKPLPSTYLVWIINPSVDACEPVQQFEAMHSPIYIH